MMTKTSWLLAGAAVTLFAGATAAVAADAAQEAARDSARAGAPPASRPDGKTETREVRIIRQNGEERIVISKDGERREIISRPGKTGRVEIRRGDGDRTVFFHEMGGGRAENMKALLQLRADQEPALKAFLDATQPDRGRDHMVRLERGTDQRSTSERLAEMEQKLAEQNAAMRKRIDATRAFYAQLDEKQKKAFDAMPMLMMVGPGMGPMLMPGPIPIMHRFEIDPVAPVPPVPPLPPAPPERRQF